MIQFTEDFLEQFLATVRKYMQLRGGLTQKDLAEMTGVGISSMSRFLNLKTATIDEQLVANIIATLNIPLHEIIDGIVEDSTETFKRLVLFYKEQRQADKPKEESSASENKQSSGGKEQTRLKTTATINIGGRSQEIPFGDTVGKAGSDTTIRDKLQSLSPRQKAYMTDFLDLNQEDRDLVVDLGEVILRYFRTKSVTF